MTTVNPNEFLWVEKHRPQTLSECILPVRVKSVMNGMVENGELQNLLLSGRAGTGKTTAARALCNDLGVDVMFINASEQSGIDTLRTTIKGFASTMSFEGNRKAVILDEADYLNPQSTQPALRAFIEEFSNNCQFILTANFPNRIIEPLHSRTTSIDFRLQGKDEQKEVFTAMGKRLFNILEQEGIEYDKKVVGSLLKKFFPDYRRVINELQRYASGGKIDEGILSVVQDVSVEELMKHMKAKNFGEARKWIVENLDQEPSHIFRRIYDGLKSYFEDSSVPTAILILAEYQYKSAFVSDQEINLAACIAELMAETTFK